MAALTYDANAFLRCLQGALSNNKYDQMNFKPKQVVCMESIFLNRDTLVILPTGYGKSVTFHLLPRLLQLRNEIHRTATNTAATVSVILVLAEEEASCDLAFRFTCGGFTDGEIYASFYSLVE